MGLFSAVKKEVKRQFIARPDEAKDTIMYKWPDQNIRMLTQLTVQADEKAVFFKEGQVKGTLDSGKHTLDGKNIPFLGALIDAATGGDFLMSELYFISTRQFTDCPFGGMIDNVMDPTTNLAVGIRLFGEYAIRVDDPEKLILQLIGTKNMQSNEELTDWIKDLLLKVFRESVSEYVSVKKQPILGIASQISEFEKLVLEKVKVELKDYGVSIPKLGNVTISIKEEDEATLKQMTRDFAYSKNAAAADAAVKLGMAKGLQTGSGAGSTAAQSAAAGMGIAMGMDAIKSSKAPEQPAPKQSAPKQPAPAVPQNKPEVK
ncbi:MAG: SPFH domain-containing protein [Patescibacteria group bacterium]|nr:SPFH domain-containing protein [Patescibacteria group bacterium]